MRKKLLYCLLAALPLTVFLSDTALAVPPLLLSDYSFHKFDPLIIAALGHDPAAAKVVYYREFASLNAAQSETKNRFEAVGCHAFQIVKDGVADESGFDCRTFFCVGFERGPKQCRTADNKPYGGVVEMNKRFGMTYISAKRKNFADFATYDQSATMKQQVTEMAMIKCTPFYLMEFDVAVGQGYSCDEIGQYPYYSGNINCTNDWRKRDGLVCDTTVKPDELAFRKVIMESRYGVSFSSSSSSSSVASSQSSSTAAGTFSDVIAGRYGYTAIMDLAKNNIVRGYDDGTFRPQDPVNRAEFMKLLVAGVFNSLPDSTKNCFPDVAEQWFTPYVCTGKRLGWLQGYADGTFKPERSITGAEALKVVVATLGFPLDSTVPLPAGVPATAWYAPYVRVAVERGLLLEANFQGTTLASRADVAVWIYRARKLQQAK